MRPSPRTTPPRDLRTPVARAAVRPASRTAGPALLAALVAAFATLLLTAQPAAAHNALRSSDPADGAAVASAPAQITLTFDQAALEIGSEVVVTAADGTVVSSGPVQLADVAVVQPLAEQRPAGAYRVDWRVTSADGHPISGTFGFTATEAVGAPAAGAPTDAATDAATPTAEASEEASAEASPSESVDTTADMGGSGEAARDGYPGTTPVWVWVLALVAVIAAVFTVATLRQRRGRSTGDAPDVAHGTPQDRDPGA